MKEHTVVIRNGAAEFVYSDDLAGLAAQAEVTRASHVEPASGYCAACGLPVAACDEVSGSLPHRLAVGLPGRWVADMRPSGGPVLWGPEGTGYPTRQAALDAERVWLRENRGL